MPRIDNKRFYNGALNRHGYSAKGLNWNSKETQEIRFEAILLLISHEIKSSSIIDAGCGFGDLYLFLMQKEALPKRYVGYDLMDNFISYASIQTAQKIEKKDILVDELESVDFYVASGSLNILKPYEAIVFMQRCLAHSKKGFVFNFLEGEDKSESFNYMKRDEVLKLFDGYEIKIKDDYLEGDVTLLVQTR